MEFQRAICSAALLVGQGATDVVGAIIQRGEVVEDVEAGDLNRSTNSRNRLLAHIHGRDAHGLGGLEPVIIGRIGIEMVNNPNHLPHRIATAQSIGVAQLGRGVNHWVRVLDGTAVIQGDVTAIVQVLQGIGGRTGGNHIGGLGQQMGGKADLPKAAEAEIIGHDQILHFNKHPFVGFPCAATGQGERDQRGGNGVALATEGHSRAREFGQAAKFSHRARHTNQIAHTDRSAVEDEDTFGGGRVTVLVSHFFLDVETI